MTTACNSIGGKRRCSYYSCSLSGEITFGAISDQSCHFPLQRDSGTPSIPTLFLTMGEGHMFQCTIHKHALKLHPILFQADILFVLKNIHDVLEQKIKLSSSQIELT